MSGFFCFDGVVLGFSGEVVFGVDVGCGLIRFAVVCTMGTSLGDLAVVFSFVVVEVEELLVAFLSWSLSLVNICSPVSFFLAFLFFLDILIILQYDF